MDEGVSNGVRPRCTTNGPGAGHCTGAGRTTWAAVAAAEAAFLKRSETHACRDHLSRMRTPAGSCGSQRASRGNRARLGTSWRPALRERRLPSLPPAISCLEFYGKRSFSVTTPRPRLTRFNTERLAERETLLYRLGSDFNRTVQDSCGNPIIRNAKTRDFSATRFFWEQSHFHEIDYFWKHQTSNSRLRHSI